MQASERGSDARATRLAHILWIVGAPDAGKTSVARELARRHDLLRYHQDSLEPEHVRRATPE